MKNSALSRNGRSRINLNAFYNLEKITIHMLLTFKTETTSREYISTESVYIKLFPLDYFRTSRLDSNYSWSINRIENFNSKTNLLKLINTDEKLTEEISLCKIKAVLNKKKSFSFSYNPQEYDLFEVKLLTKNGYLNRTFCFINDKWETIEVNSNDFLLETIQSGVIRIIKRKKLEFKK